jgi:hypothetical protein
MSEILPRCRQCKDVIFGERGGYLGMRNRPAELHNYVRGHVFGKPLT